MPSVRVLYVFIGMVFITPACSDSRFWECHNGTEKMFQYPDRPNIFRSSHPSLRLLKEDMTPPNDGNRALVTYCLPRIETSLECICNFKYPGNCSKYCTIEVQLNKVNLVLQNSNFDFFQIVCSKNTYEVWLRGSHPIPFRHIQCNNVRNIHFSSKIPLQGFGIGSFYSITLWLKRLKTVHVLDLTNINLQQKEFHLITSVCDIIKDKEIRTLSLRGYMYSTDKTKTWNLTKIGITKLLTLQYLDISNNGVIYFAGFKQLLKIKSLIYLDISENFLGAAGNGLSNIIMFTLHEKSSIKVFMALDFITVRDGLYRCSSNGNFTSKRGKTTDEVYLDLCLYNSYHIHYNIKKLVIIDSPLCEYTLFGPCRPSSSTLVEIHFVSVKYNCDNLRCEQLLDFFSILPTENLKVVHILGGKIRMYKQLAFCTRNSTLKSLTLSSIDIQGINRDSLTNCTALVNLSLNNNAISQVNFSLPLSVEFLNLSYNQIKRMTPLTTQRLNHHYKLNPNFTIDLMGNELDCTCYSEAIKTVQWIQTTEINIFAKDSLTCLGNHGEQNIMSIDMLAYYVECTDLKYVIVVTSTVPTTIIIIGCITFIFKCRYRIKTKFYKLKQRTCQQGKKQNEKEVRSKYDAYLVYCSEDRFWVHDNLVKVLEGRHGFELCVHYRDFPLGEDLVDVIIDYMKQSENIIVILSENSVAKPWCQFELKQAHAFSVKTGKPLIIIKLGYIPRDKCESLVISILDSKTYLKWPDNKPNISAKDLRDKQTLFWYKLASKIYKDENNSCCACLCNRSEMILRVAEGANEEDGIENGDDNPLILNTNEQDAAAHGEVYELKQM